MKKAGRSLLLFFLFTIAVPAQSNDDKLLKLSRLIEDGISQEMSGWTCKAFKPSKEVAIQHWSSGEIGVKVAVVDYASPARASEAFNESKAHFKLEEVTAANHGRSVRLIKEESLNLGDEGFVWDILGSDAVEFRKGELLISVSIFSPSNARDVYFSRKFAALAAAILKSS